MKINFVNTWNMLLVIRKCALNEMSLYLGTSDSTNPINLWLKRGDIDGFERVTARMVTIFRRGFKERRTGRTPPPLKFPKIIGYSGIYIYVYIRTDISVNSYVTIIYLPLNSDFISIIQTLLGSSDL